MIYVHIPFCRSFCTYCDFYSEVASHYCDSFADALVNEVKTRGHEIDDQVNTLYIGGGTPSVLPSCVYERLLSALSDVGHGGPYDEFTVEVNPDDIAAKGEGYVEELLKLGVNRISMGVQSFDDGILKFMNRRHDVATARKAYAVLENAGVENISIDLIFGLPQLSDGQWRNTLRDALDISSKGNLPRHISSYQLSVEPGSMLAGMMAKGRFVEASEELCEGQYDILCETLAEAGYGHYEISNFALPGFEALHNSAYWRHVPYAGFGPGAHSLIRRSSLTADSGFKGAWMRQWNKPDLKKYIEDQPDIREFEILSEEQLEIERIMLSLRTSAGIPSAFLESGCDPRALEKAYSSGNLVRLKDGHSRIPESRFFISDSIISELI